MRAKDEALKTCALAWLVAVVGCAGAGPKPQAENRVSKSQARATVDDSLPLSEAAKQRTDDAANVDMPGQERDHKGERSPAAAHFDPPRESEAQPVTALKPPIVRPAVMPEVLLSVAHADDCFIRVGDQFPDFRLPDLQGRASTLADVRGDGLTVVAFWSSDRLVVEEQLRYLVEQIGRYADLGVRAVAVNVGEPPERVRPAVEEFAITVPVLLDPDRRLFSRIGKDHLPRTYLLDRDGRVLWFDIEFSRHTRERLEQAIHASLKSA